MSDAQPEVERLEDLAGDLSRTHRTVHEVHDVPVAQVDADLAALDRDGYVILESLRSARHFAKNSCSCSVRTGEMRSRAIGLSGSTA